MAIHRRDYRPSLSRQQKLNRFRDCTVVHPHLKKAYEEFRDAVSNPGGASLIFLFGPTGVGKTTLLRQKLGLLGVSSSVSSTDNSSLTKTNGQKRRRKQRPGVRQPSRDVVGET